MLPTLLAQIDKSVCCLAKHVTTQCAAGPGCTGIGNKDLSEGRTELKMSQLDVPGCQRSQSFVSDLNDLLVPQFKSFPCQVAARIAFEIGHAAPMELEDDLRPNECRHNANITESIELDDYPLILSVGLGALRFDQEFYQTDGLPKVYTLQRGHHSIVYRMVNVTNHDFAMHFNADLFVPSNEDGRTMTLHYDAIEGQRVVPYDPNCLTDFKPVHAMFLRV